MQRSHLPDRERLASALADSLYKTIFSGGLRITPRRVQQIARQIAATFSHFAAEGDEQKVQAQGRTLAADGLGPPSILALSETLCRSQNGTGSNPDLATRFIVAMLGGYMTEREKRIVREQERIRRAWQRTLESRRGTAQNVGFIADG